MPKPCLPAPALRVGERDKPPVYPASARGHLAPEAADPDEVVTGIIEVPVAGDPGDGVTIGPVFRGLLIERAGRLPVDEGGLGGFCRLGVGLVDNTPLRWSTLLGRLEGQGDQAGKHK